MAVAGWRKRPGLLPWGRGTTQPIWAEPVAIEATVRGDRFEQAGRLQWLAGGMPLRFARFLLGHAFCNMQGAGRAMNALRFVESLCPSQVGGCCWGASGTRLLRGHAQAPMRARHGLARGKAMPA